MFSAFASRGSRADGCLVLDPHAGQPLAEGLEDRAREHLFEGSGFGVREIDALPELLRSSVVLVYYQGLKYREAADALEVPVGTVKSRLHSALLKLNAAWLCSRGGDAP